MCSVLCAKITLLTRSKSPEGRQGTEEGEGNAQDTRDKKQPPLGQVHCRSLLQCVQSLCKLPGRAPQYREGKCAIPESRSGGMEKVMRSGNGYAGLPVTVCRLLAAFFNSIEHLLTCVVLQPVL